MLLLVFMLDDHRYALHLESVERVIRAVEITPLPGAPEHILGLISLHGRIAPVLNVRKRLGLPEKELDITDHMIVAQTENRPLVLLVDGVCEVIDYPEREIMIKKILPVGEDIEGLVKLEDDIVFIEYLHGLLLPLDDPLPQPT